MENNIRKIREANNLSLLDLSALCSLSVGYLCHLENGSRSNPSYSSMVKICKALNKDISEVFTIL